MLRRLHVKQFALIDDTELEFTSGFNVLSGETGAGKSIIIGAIGLILGERATTAHVREGAPAALIEALFHLQEGNPQADAVNLLLQDAGITPSENSEPLIVSREVFSDGRSSIARVNGRTVPVSFLKELGPYLVDLHGQHRHQSLLRPEMHLELLDAFGAEKITPLRQELSSLLNKKNKCRSQLREIGHDARERERRLDLLNFQINEIEEASLSPEEEEQHLKKQQILANAEKITAAVAEAYRQLTGDGGSAGIPLRDQLGQVLQEINGAAGHDASLQSVAELMEGASAQLEEASHELRSYRDDTNFNPQELEQVQERLETIRNLKRKYGETIEEVLAFAEQCREESERLRSSEELAAQLEQEINELDEQINSICAKLTKMRRETARSLEKQLQEVFPQLSLEKAVIKTEISPRDITARGADSIEFLFSANPGEPPKPLVSIISGGEVSRVMLALKTVFARQDLVPTLIFDEADAGIGGAAVRAVAEKLAGLSRLHQVLVVTHSPQVASMADTHYLLSKEVRGQRTTTGARLLQPEERRKELARMLDGGPDPVNLEHAEVLLERAKNVKQEFNT